VNDDRKAGEVRDRAGPGHALAVDDRPEAAQEPAGAGPASPHVRRLPHARGRAGPA